MPSITVSSRVTAVLALAAVSGPALALDGMLPSAAPASWFELEPTLSSSIASAPRDAPSRVDHFGATLLATSLDALRGGDATSENRNNVNGRVSDNVAEDVVTGDNVLGGSAFAGASGISTVIQNSGSNVLIQNATIVSVQFADPSP